MFGQLQLALSDQFGMIVVQGFLRDLIALSKVASFSFLFIFEGFVIQEVQYHFSFFLILWICCPPKLIFLFTSCLC